ncbi:MAG: DUF2267 domain-containing protein [Frankia sp.]|nr:DUF2267 domain-containing protein [Frankia sp.]
MKQDELVAAIRATGRIGSVAQAEAAVRATLAVLGQRIAGGETKDLASQLPPAFAEALPRSGGGERFGVDEFYRRVAELEGDFCSPQLARRHARAVMAALRASVTPTEFEDVAGQLPADYDDLLSREPVIHY